MIESILTLVVKPIIILPSGKKAPPGHKARGFAVLAMGRIPKSIRTQQ